jgi:hypothetical protein
MMKRTFLLLILATSLLVSCRSTRNIQAAITKIDTTTVIPVVEDHSKVDTIAFIQDNYRKVMNNRLDYTSFSAKMDVDYAESDGKKYNVNAHIRMYKDSVIWVSITAILGIEGLRAYITRDSVKMLNKQDKVYIARSVSYLQEVTALPLNLHSLQELIIGNPVYLDSTIMSYDRNTTQGTISLQSTGEFFRNLFTIMENEKLVVSSKLDDVDQTHNRTCLLTYADYENKKGVNFSTKREISVSEKKKLDIKLDFKQYEFNETLSFPFNVPKNYTRN